MPEAVWKTLKLSKAKKSRRSRKTTRKRRVKKQRGGNYDDVPSGLGGTVTGRMGDEIDSLNVTRSIAQTDKIEQV